MGPNAHELMRTTGNALVGVFGTLAAVEWQQVAATAAGFATAAWMLTQIYIAISNHRKKGRK